MTDHILQQVLWLFLVRLPAEGLLQGRKDAASLQVKVAMKKNQKFKQLQIPKFQEPPSLSPGSCIVLLQPLFREIEKEASTFDFAFALSTDKKHIPNMVTMRKL